MRIFNNRRQKVPATLELPDLDSTCIQQFSKSIDRADEQVARTVNTLVTTVTRLTEVVSEIRTEPKKFERSY